MATPISLNGGVFMRQTDFPSVKGHLDSADLFSFFQDKPEPTDMGMVEYFVNSGFMPERATSLTMNAKRVFLSGHEFKYSHPTTDKEFYILEDLSFSDKAGMAGAKFKAKFNTKKYDNGWIITPDPQSRFHLLVTADEILRDGDGWIYTLELKTYNKAESYFPKYLLSPNTRFYGLSTIETEYSQTYSSIPEFGGGKREFMSYVGKSGSQLHYSVTRDAAMGQIGERSLFNYNQYLEGIQTFQFKPGTLGWNLSYQTPEQKQAYGGDVTALYKKAAGGSSEQGERMMKRDSILSAWAPKVEMLGVKLLNQMVETDAFYGSGGTLNFDGRTDTMTTLGLFHQFMLGNTHNYNIHHLSLEYFESIITSRLEGKMEYNPSMSGPTVIIKTGRGGIAMIQELASKMPSNNGLLWTTDKIITGLGVNNGALHFETPQFVSWRMKSGLATLRFEYEPSLDPQTANTSINPIVPVNKGVGGHRLSSYIYIIEDLAANTKGENVCELLYGPDWDIRKSVTQGKLAYPALNPSGGTWLRSDNGAGFTVYLEQKHKAYWLKDPTRSLVIKPNNPYTGKPIFEY